MNELTEKMDRFEAMRLSLLEGLSEIPEDQLTARPMEGKWSILEIVEHMAVAEREVLMGLPGHSELTAFQRTFKNKLMLKIVMFVLGNRIRVKVPSKTMNPKGGTSLSEVRSLWDESQAWFRDYVRSLSEDELQNAVFKHPVSGPITPAQAMDMSFAHFESHRAQIDRLLEVIEADGSAN